MEKQLYVKITDNIDGDTWVLGPARDGGISAVKEWIEVELEDKDDNDAVDARRTIGFVMMTEDEVNALPEP